MIIQITENEDNSFRIVLKEVLAQREAWRGHMKSSESSSTEILIPRAKICIVPLASGENVGSGLSISPC